MTLAGDDRGPGRSRELATAVSALDAARAGSGSALAVTGPPGVGKTWLCETVAETARREDFGVGWGAAWPGGGAPPLWPWQQALATLGEPATDLFGSPPDTGSPDWFQRCVEIVEHLRAMTAQRPGVLVVDDAHSADDHSRHLAWFLARNVRGLPLVLLLAHEPHEGLAAFDREAIAVPLHGLGPADVAALLRARGVADLTDAELSFVLDVTGGMPRELQRLANASTAGTGIVRALVADRLAALPDDVRHAAACAAILDAAPRLDELAEVVAIDPFAVAAALEELGLASRGPDRLTFGHWLVQLELAATLAPEDRLAVHARAARLLADGPPSVERLQRRAKHALAAATSRSEDDAALAVDASRDAAAALLAANDPEAAAELLARAERVYETVRRGRPSAALLAAHAEAVLRCGHLAAAREQFGRAVAAAAEDGDATSLAIAALGLGGVWLAEHRSAIDRDRILALQRRARDGLTTDQAALRVRLGVRLAAEEAYATGRSDKIEAAMAEARMLENPAVLAEALSLYHHTMLGPEHGERRLRVAREMLSITARSGDNWLSLMALLWLTSDLFLAGDRQAERSLGELRERAATQGGRHAAYIASVMDSMLLLRAGRFAEAERAAETAFEVGETVGDADAVAYYGSQIATMRWMQGRSAEVVELAAVTATDPTITPANVAFVAMFASLAADGGELDRARAALARLRGGLHTMMSSSTWLATLFSIVETAYLLDDAAIAAEAAALMTPYADLPVMGSLGITCVGSVRRSLGLAAVIAGEADRGIRWLEAAVDDDERLGNRPMAALTVAELAQAYADRAGPGDRATAVALLDRAIREADAMGLSIRAAQWRTRRAAVAGDTASSPDAAAAGHAGPAVGVIRRLGTTWALELGGGQVVVPDLLGMTYLSRLLTNPGVEIAATTLVAAGSGMPPVGMAALAVQPEQPVLDDTALAAYRERVTDLEDELAEAERYADSERAARARVELDALVDELARTTNRFGKARPFASSNERARTNVQKALRRVLDAVESADSRLAGTLRASIHTGRTCSYSPTDDAPTRWEQHGPH